MKKIITQFIAIALFPTLGSAQITITHSDLPALFSTWVEHEDSTTHAAITPAGPSQTWDYSNFTIVETDVTNLQPLTATNSNWNANFPTAQMVHYNPSDSEAVYYSSNVSGFYLDGFYDNHAEADIVSVPFESKRMIIPTPFTYLNTTSNLASFSMEINQGFMVKVASYTHTDFTCDAYGSITTPAGTFSNTIRIKAISYNYDTTYADFGGGYQLIDFSEPNDTSITYTWMQNGSNSIVFTADELMNGSTPTGIIEEASYFDVTPPAAPNPPTNLTINPTTLKTTFDKMQLNWSDNSNNELGFNIERSIDSTNWSVLTTVGADETSYLDIGLNPMTIYYYRVSAYNGVGTSIYSNTVSGNTDGSTSINNELAEEKLQVYPNPTNGIVSIQFTNNSSTTIELYNAIGERLISEQINQSKHTIDISNYPNGVYFLKADGNMTKIIKQ